MEPVFDLLIHGGPVLTMDPAGTFLDLGWVGVESGRVARLGSGPGPVELATEVLDAQGGLVMPGLVNAHTHAAMTLFRGLADDLPLEIWLNEHIFPAEARLTPDLVAAGATLACAEMIRGGVTCFCDMYLWEDTVAQAVDRAGLRACLGEVLYDFPSPHYGSIQNGLAFTAEFIQHYRDHARISVMVMPHALYTCSPDLLLKAWSLAGRHQVGVHVHLAESAGEVREVQARHGERPVGHLNKLGLLTDNSLFAHAVHLTDQEIELLAAAGCRAAHCPESNLKLASGIARLPEMLSAGMIVGLGTDGASSNNDLSMFGEMRTCALLEKGVKMDPTAVGAKETLALATRGSAAALGLEDQIGSLEPGKRADLIVVDFDQPHLTPVFHYPSHLVYAARSTDVRHTVVEGRVLMRDRQLTTLDLPEVLARARAAGAIVRGNHG